MAFSLHRVIPARLVREPIADVGSLPSVSLPEILRLFPSGIGSNFYDYLIKFHFFQFAFYPVPLSDPRPSRPMGGKFL